MAKEIESKKRKASMLNGEKMKKPKKVAAGDADIAAKKRKAIEDPTPITVKKPKTPKPTAVEEVKPKALNKKESNQEQEGKASSEKSHQSTKDSTSAVKKAKSAGKHAKGTDAVKSKKTEDVLSLNDDDNFEEEDDDDDDSESESFEEDDQTVALLKGFESEGDEEDAENEGGLEPGQEVPKIPALSKKQMKRIADAGGAEKPGVVYIGRIPHGFYENEMRAYFSQFGKILKLRLSRNRKTGQSKHIAWIQFESASVAEITAKATDSYLLFGHILKVKVVPDEQIPENLFKGANRRFKKVPWGKIEARKLSLAASESTWDKRIEREEKRREEKTKKLKSIGYEFEAPKIKSTKGVAKKSSELQELAPTEESTQDEVLAIESVKAPALEAAKPKKGKKAKASVPVEEVSEEPATALALEISEKPKKKDKKPKAAAVEQDAAPTEIANGEKKLKKNKKPRVSV
ncbi:hypothetical protein B7463_g8551, partial [Scytalidium lignicola]